MMRISTATYEKVVRMLPDPQTVNDDMIHLAYYVPRNPVSARDYTERPMDYESGHRLVFRKIRIYESSRGRERWCETWEFDGKIFVAPMEMAFNGN